MQKRSTIAYLAPEIPALSATFVYEEMLALERRGYRTIPFSVRPPSQLASDQPELAARVTYLYEGSKSGMVFAGLAALARPCNRNWKALRWLVEDMSVTGWFRLSAWKLVFQFLAAARLAGKLIHEKCTHLHVHFAHTPAQIGMYASALSGVPFTITAHANDIFERGTLLKQKARRAQLLLTISEHNRQYLEKLGIPPHQLAVVRCGVSFPRRSNPEQSSRTGAFRIGSLGRMVEKKGFDVLLNAIRELRSTGMEIVLEIAGDGPLIDNLASLSRTLGVDGVTRLVGSLPHGRVATWLQTLDVFVLACKVDSAGDMDGIPVVLMESMSQSVPVVSTRISGIPELVVDGVTGLLAAPADPNDLARQIKRIADSPELARTLAENGAKHVITEFGQDINLDRLIAAFTGSVKQLQ